MPPAMLIDDSVWPLVVTRWEGAASQAEVDDFLARMDGWLARGQRFGLLLDTRGSLGLSSEQRDQILRYMKARAEATKALLTQAIVMDNQIMRLLYYTVSWMQPLPFVSKAFVSPEEARAWLESSLASPALPRG